MRCLTTIFFLLIAVACTSAQEKPAAVQKYDVKRCSPKVVKSHISSRPIHFRKGEKSSGYSPIVSFQILESGAVANAHLERSSGFSDIDASALEWIRTMRYNSRSGCGIVETKAGVTVDFF